jgi:acetylornithine deacetylase/succinyl-diaminopimelate desuccinylase family protein
MYQTIMDYIEKNQEKLIENVKKLVSVDSTNPGMFEKEAAAELQAQLGSAGIGFEIYEPFEKRVSVLAQMESSQSRGGLLFNGHLDVVPTGDLSQWESDPFKPEIRNGRLYGRGSTDMKGGVAAFAFAMKAVKECGVVLKKPVYLHAVADEECGGRAGTVHLMENHRIPAVDMAVTGESSTFKGEMALVRTCAGIAAIVLRSYGKSAHASKPYEGNNAVLNMARVMLAIQDSFEVPARSADPLLPAPTFAVGTQIKGGIKVNIIPEYCEAMMDLRTNPGMTKEGIEAQLREIIQKVKESHPEVKAEAECTMWDNAALLAEDSYAVRKGKEAIRRAVGYEPECKMRSGATDARFLNDLVPCLVAYGPGDVLLGNIHGSNESVGIRDLVNWAKAYANLILSVCGDGDAQE